MDRESFLARVRTSLADGGPRPVRPAPYRPPAPEVVDRFTAILHAAGVRVTLRRDRGRDIDAACGQLANRAVPAAVVGPDPSIS